MGEAGIFGPEERTELLDGEIIVMAPIGRRHAACVDWLTEAFYASARLAGRAQVRVQNPMVESDLSEPQPDVMLMAARPDRYALGHPGPDEVLLLVEVAESSLNFDRRTKIPFYASAGIREVWLVDLVHDCIDVYTGPGSGGYQVTRSVEMGETLAPSSLPDLELEVARIIPPRPERDRPTTA